MKLLLAGSTLLFWLVIGPIHLGAQTNTAANAAPSRENWMISFLTPAEQDKYARVHAKALTDNPQLKTAGEHLMMQGKTLMESGTAADRQAFIEKMNSHRQKLRQAMLKEDPTLQPIFDEIDKHISEMKAKHAGQNQNSPGGTNAPSGGPAAGH